jgi:DNA polymerase elongation subunit (family B)
MNDSLIYGKSNLRRVVGLEVKDGTAEIFIQDIDGNINSEIRDNRYWVLSHNKLSKNAARMSGNLYYKYGYQFKEKADWQRFRAINRNNDIYSCYNNEEAFMLKDGITFFRDLTFKEISLLSFDLETTGLDGLDKDAKILLISTTFRDKNSQVNKLFAYDNYNSEKDMIIDFCKYVRKCNPSLIVGHNILTFDFPYLQNRCDTLETELKMGRDNSTIQFNNYDSKFRLDGTRELLYKGVTIYGREIVDTFFLASSFDVSKSIESYALKPMIKQLGFEKEGRQYYDAGSIRDHYKNPTEWAKIKQYAVEDAEDAVKIWDYMGPLYFNMAPMMPKPFTEILLSASGSKINGMMVRAYLQDGHSLPKADEAQKFQGAISFGVPGLYKNCFKIDLAALYPSIMIQYEVYDSDKDPKAYLLQMVKIFREKRLEYKKLAAETGDNYWKEMDTTAKGILNSFYGFMGASGLLFNSMPCAEFITAKGREILEFTINWAAQKKLSDFMEVTEFEEEVNV